MLVALTVCTRRRPIQLSTALAALAKVRAPVGVDLRIIVIENDSSENVRKIVEEQCRPRAFEYFLETEPGLSPARNRAIEIALAMGAEWVSTSDDDGEMDSECIVEFLEAAADFPARQVFMGRTHYIFPRTMPKWYPRPDTSPRPTGSRPRVYSTSNAFFNRRVVAVTGFNQRFDNDFRFSGGEDSDFFSRIARLGGPAVWVEQAMVTEKIVSERADLKLRFRRQMRNGQNSARILRKLDRPIVAFLKIFHLVYKLTVFGLVKVFVGGFQLIFDRTAGLTKIFQGLSELASAFGMARAYFLKPNEWYKKNDGH